MTVMNRHGWKCACARPVGVGLGLWFLVLAIGLGAQTHRSTEPTSAPRRECVILLHGLGRTFRSMAEMAEALEAAGYLTVNLDYPSRDYRIETLANTAIPEGIGRCAQAGANRMHFVSHSLGGILVRYYLSHHSVERLGRVVMLSPPNQGSEVADELKDMSLYFWINGPAGQQLGTGPDSVPASLGPVNYPAGIITGNRSAFYDAWLSDMIPGENDGKVAVKRARVEGMADFLVVPYAHSFIMSAPEVIAQTVHFLRHGHFRKADDLDH
jgi:pimeloyl-ACP methyl ester carboxylesterase